MTKKAMVKELYDQGVTSQKEIALKTGFKYRHVCEYVYEIRHPEKSSLAGRKRRKRWHDNNREKDIARIKMARRVHQKATRISAGSHHQEWLLRDIEYLKENCSKQSTRQIAEHLGRTYRSIQWAAKKFGVSLRGNKIGAEFVGIYEKRVDAKDGVTQTTGVSE